MTFEKFYTGNKFRLLTDLRSMGDETMHGSGTRLVNTTDGVQLQIKRKIKGSGNVKFYVAKYLVSCIRGADHQAADLVGLPAANELHFDAVSQVFHRFAEQRNVHQFVEVEFKIRSSLLS